MSKKKNAERDELQAESDITDSPTSSNEEILDYIGECEYWGAPKTKYDYREFLFNDVTRDLLFPELFPDSIAASIALAVRNAYDEGNKLLKALASSGIDIVSGKRFFHDGITSDAVKTLLFHVVDDAVMTSIEKLTNKYMERKIATIDGTDDYYTTAISDLSAITDLVTARLSKLPEYHLLFD